MQLKLKTARKRRKLSLIQLAAKTGLNKSTINRIERGIVRPLHETVVTLEDALEYPHGTLKFEAHREVSL